MKHPFAEAIGLSVDEQRPGYSRCALSLSAEKHHNPNGVTHGAVLYALADTGMGAALSSTLGEGEICATIEIKINYFKAVSAGTIVCVTELRNRGRSIANLDASLYLDDRLIAQANGNFAILAAPSNAHRNR